MCVCFLRKEALARGASRSFFAGPECFMQSPAEVAKLLHWKRYHEHWPDIPEEELKASAVNLRIGDTDQRQLVLLHKRRVSQAQADGDEKVFVCSDCHDSFRLKIPQLCKFSFANHMWIGRWDPLFRIANIAHQMLCSNYISVVEKLQEVLAKNGKHLRQLPWKNVFEKRKTIYKKS